VFWFIPMYAYNTIILIYAYLLSYINSHTNCVSKTSAELTSLLLFSTNVPDVSGQCAMFLH